MEMFILAFLALLVVFSGSFAFAAIRRMSRWNRTYDRIGKRYGGRPRRRGIAYGLGLTRPSLNFDYGRTLCAMRNRKSYRFPGGRQTEISMIWPDRKIKFEVSTVPARPRNWGGPGRMQQILIEDPQFQSDFYTSGNDPQRVQRLLSSGVRWQIVQLRRHLDNNDVQITLNRGNLVVSKPGYIKGYVALEDFLRFSLDLFDQLMLVNAEGIEFVNANQAFVVDDVKCPICSEEIIHSMVVCARCKTPHCQDCWQYNGQCATFACSETRCLHAGQLAN
jgi:hypothetical protein